MALSQATLSTALQAITPSETPNAGAAAIAQAYGTYMSTAQALTPILVVSIPLAVTAMTAAMSFADDATAAEGAAVFQDGVQAFWNAMNSPASAYFASATAVTPPAGLSTLANVLEPIFEANTSGEASLSAASDAIATALHTASLGGTTTTPTSVITPIT